MDNMLNKGYKNLFILCLFIFLLFRSISVAQQTSQHSEFVGITFPITEASVNTAGDYYVYIVATDKPESADVTVSIF